MSAVLRAQPGTRRPWCPASSRSRITANVRLFLLNRFPGAIRIEALHLCKFIKTGRPKIFFIHNAVLAHHEGLDTCFTILGWSSCQSKSPNHNSLHHVVQFAERRSGSLAFQASKKIAVVRLRFNGVSAIALFKRTGDLFADRPAPAAVRVLPG